MKEKLFRELLLFAMSKEHRTMKMLDCFAEFVNDTNRILVRVLDHLNIEVRYNTTYDTVVEIVSMPAVYSFMDELLGRTNARRVEPPFTKRSGTCTPCFLLLSGERLRSIINLLHKRPG